MRRTQLLTHPLRVQFHQKAASRVFRAFPRPYSIAAAATTTTTTTSNTASSNSNSTNPALSFPCLDHLERRTEMLSQSLLKPNSISTIEPESESLAGPEPSYTSGEHQTFVSEEPIILDWGGILPTFNIAYETWGTLNTDRSNVILLHPGLSASSHAHSTPENPQQGWWEKFIGPGKALDTDKYFVICTNVIGGCYGSTGPSSIDPANGQPYATRFPILTIDDMVRAQFRLLDHLEISRLYASIGSSMGGLLSLSSAINFPDRVGKIVSISGCIRCHPSGIALRHTQRQVLMMDPNWARGFYYSSIPPHAGMKLAREIATVSYRSGPEWDNRFGRRRADPSRPPALCPDFLIETYLDHAGEKWCLQFDPNSLLYLSKAMDLFDLGAEARSLSDARRGENSEKLAQFVAQQRLKKDHKDTARIEPPKVQGTEACAQGDASCTLTLPETPYEEKVLEGSNTKQHNSSSDDLISGVAALKNIPTLVLGVKSDILFPAWQQKELADTLRAAGNANVTHVELTEEQSSFGHDTFLLDVHHVGQSVQRFLN